ncbi:hypothetical protein ACGFJT_37080 [Actinomadura geliboluensis]|uniref:hypothetical protein n=1 Tax=Actinomadura geliboluensis TaxID=882440 RepID=UPI003717FA06
MTSRNEQTREFIAADLNDAINYPHDAIRLLAETGTDDTTTTPAELKASARAVTTAQSTLHTQTPDQRRLLNSPEPDLATIAARPVAEATVIPPDELLDNLPAYLAWLRDPARRPRPRLDREPSPPAHRPHETGDPAVQLDLFAGAHGRPVVHVVRGSVLRYPDLAAKLREPPLKFRRPEQWNGYIPPDTCGSAPNLSPRRDALIVLVEEAARRDREGWPPEPKNSQSPAQGAHT